MKLATTVAAAVLAYTTSVVALPQASVSGVKPTGTTTPDPDPDTKKGVLVLYTDDGDSEELNAHTYWPGVLEARSEPEESDKFYPFREFGRLGYEHRGKNHQARDIGTASDPVIEIMPSKRALWNNKFWIGQHGPSPDSSDSSNSANEDAHSKRALWNNKFWIGQHGPSPDEEDFFDAANKAGHNKRAIWNNKFWIGQHGPNVEAAVMPESLRFHPSGEYKPNEKDN